MTSFRHLDDDLLAMAAVRGRGFTLASALAARIPRGRDEGTTLAAVARSPNAAAWLTWATTRPAGWWPLAFEAALELVVAELFPSIAHGEGRWPA